MTKKAELERKPSEECKTAGLKGLSELTDISGVSKRTLINWHKNKHQAFNLMIHGAVFKQAIERVKE